MRPTISQQAIAGLAVMFVIIATLLGGVVLALGERSSPTAGIAEAYPTATPIRLATLAPTQRVLPPPTLTPVASTPTSPSPIITDSAPPPTIVPPAARATALPTSSPPRPTATRCVPHADWVAYTVQPGENLYRIGLRYGQTVTQMIAANCLADENVDAGQVIRVPPIAPAPADTTASATTPASSGIPLPQPVRTPGPTATQTASDGACANPDSIITYPGVGAVLTGNVTITGTARLPNFSFYKLELRQEGTDQGYITFYTGDTEVINGTLAVFNTSAYPDGEYWIRLVVVDGTGNYPERCAMLVIFNN